MNVLVTRCPACGTAFRAAPAQLSARSGMVRCGKCRAVFDGVAHLEDEPDSARLANEPSPQLGLFDQRLRTLEAKGKSLGLRSKTVLKYCAAAPRS